MKQKINIPIKILIIELFCSFCLSRFIWQYNLWKFIEKIENKKQYPLIRTLLSIEPLMDCIFLYKLSSYFNLNNNSLFKYKSIFYLILLILISFLFKIIIIEKFLIILLAIFFYCLYITIICLIQTDINNYINIKNKI